MEAYVGVDWSATEVVCSTAMGDEPPRRIIGAKRTFEGVRDLMKRVDERHPEADRVHVIIEAGSPGWAELFHHAGGLVHVADAKQAKAFAASVCSSGAKDDGRDSTNLVEMGRSSRHLPDVWAPDSELRVRLRELAAMHEAISKDLVVAQQRLRSHLRERLPALEAVLRNLRLLWVRQLLRAMPTAWHIRQMTEEQVLELLRTCGARRATRAKVAEAIRASNAPWVTQGVAQAQATRVIIFVEQIELLCRQLAEVDEQLDQLTADLDIRKCLESVDGIAMKLATRLIEFAFDEVPEERDQAGVLLGASPVFRGSGKTRTGKLKVSTVMRRSVHHRARATSYLLGRLASQHLDWAVAMYEDARPYPFRFNQPQLPTHESRIGVSPSIVLSAGLAATSTRTLLPGGNS